MSPSPAATTPRQLALTALLVTGGAVLSWAALLVVSRVVLLRYQIDPWSYSFLQLAAGGAALVAAGGLRQPDFTVFRRPSTWALGVLRVLSAASFTAVVVWVNVLEASVLGSINVPLAALAVWALLGRRPTRGEWVGHLVLLLAVAWLLLGLEAEILRPVLTLMLFGEACLIGATLIAEKHPDNLSARPGARLRLSGAVLLVTALLFLAIRGGSDGIAALAPTAWSWPLLTAGVLAGIGLRAPALVLSFWSIRLIGGQNYLAAVAVMPLLGLGLEALAAAGGFIEVFRFSPAQLPPAFGVVLGSLLVVGARLRAKRA